MTIIFPCLMVLGRAIILHKQHLQGLVVMAASVVIVALAVVAVVEATAGVVVEGDADRTDALRWIREKT